MVFFSRSENFELLCLCKIFYVQRSQLIRWKHPKSVGVSSFQKTFEVSNWTKRAILSYLEYTMYILFAWFRPFLIIVWNRENQLMMSWSSF